MSTIRIKRVYDEPNLSDGYRVLVDRLWPRGVTKKAAHIDEWDKTIGPSDELRTWFGHIPGRFPEFTKRYIAELDHNPATQKLASLVDEHSVLTLVYSAKDEECNQAVVLRDYLLR